MTLGQTPPQQALHTACNRYEEAIAGIPDCFAFMTGEAIRDLAAYAVSLNREGVTFESAADEFIRSHLDMLSTWRDALDALDSEFRADVVEGSLPDWAQKYLKDEALELFESTTDLQCAVTELHHGSAGPRLDPEYGHAYVLSNSTLNPFA